MKKTLFLIVAGILTIVASFVALAIGLIAFSAAQMSYSYNHGYNFYYAYYLATGVVGAVSFPLGLVAGILIVMRRRLIFCLFGLGLLVACGAVMTFPLWFFGLPILTLAILSVVLVMVSRSGFN
jgi:hypothetical protein